MPQKRKPYRLDRRTRRAKPQAAVDETGSAQDMDDSNSDDEKETQGTRTHELYAEERLKT